MSVGPTGVPGSIAGSPLSQTRGSEIDRTQQDTASQARQVKASERAEQASGIGQTEQDHEAADRDADGRRPWEFGRQPDSDQSDPSAAATDGPADDREGSPGRDATGLRGTRLDVSG